MSAQASASTYTERFNAVLAYIDANLDGDLSVKVLSQVASFSPFHFHRNLARSLAYRFHAMCN